MLEGEGIVDSSAKEPSWKLVVEWLLVAYVSTPGQTARNAWMKTGF